MSNYSLPDSEISELREAHAELCDKRDADRVKAIILSALENLAARNSRLIETYHILTNAYGIFWCYCFAKL
ncbi:hypothetical protein [Thiolapillus sp.]|uniref:hypothetical protein n=1 Tax=Thiolapillus sp. TaxID=2017437 RepID=UPI003AF73F4C